MPRFERVRAQSSTRASYRLSQDDLPWLQPGSASNESNPTCSNGCMVSTIDTRLEVAQPYSLFGGYGYCALAFGT